jgi:TonB family protein
VLGDPLEWVSPKYPKDALKRRVEGVVVLTVSVAKHGEVKNATVVSGDPDLAEAAIRAVRKWRYVPYFLNDQPIEVKTTVTISFKITDRKPDISAKYLLPSEPPIDQIVKIGPGVTPPRTFYTPDPEYTKAAQQDKVQGVVVLSCVISATGTPLGVSVTRSLRPDLDQKAIEAVRQWRFRPGTKEGKSVAVRASVEVMFHLY